MSNVTGTNIELANFIATSIREDTEQGAAYILKLVQEVNYGNRA